MNDDRKKVYELLESKIGNTPLIKYMGEVPNGNTIWIKRECDSIFGSHYDRVYFALFKEWEENHGLKPGMNVLETTSGTAGVSFAGIGKILGYNNCFVMVPDGKITKKRRDAIEEQGGIIIPTPEDEWIQGFPGRIIPYIKTLFPVKFLNHSMGKKIKGSDEFENNETTLSALQTIATEVLSSQEIIKAGGIDIFICISGNGSSIVGPGRIFKQHGTQIIGCKPKESGKNETPGAINQDALDPQKVIHFPHIREAKKLMDREIIYSKQSEKDTHPCWDIKLSHHKDLGRTTRAEISVALTIAKEVTNKNILIIGYDKIDRY